MVTPSQPIGIFDSGVGGLTVAAAVRNILPNENIIYFGDTAHLPYGDKSADSIRYYSEKIAEFLLAQDCKVILIACNTASAHAYQTVKEYVARKSGSRKVINVIDPVVEYITDKNNYSRIAVIGTKGTINSGSYPQRIIHRKPDIEVVSAATPLFVPMIEEGFIFDDISNAIIRSYLSKEKLNHLDAIILGCTHYPIIKNQIRKFYNFRVDVIDSSQVVAMKLKNYLTQNNILNTVEKTKHRFIVSDYTDMFETIARMFFDEEIHLEKIDIWQTPKEG